MAIPEACGLWIEQEIKKELDVNNKNKINFSEIGRKIAADIDKYFETKIKSDTIRVRATRMNNKKLTCTNVQDTNNTVKTGVKPKLEKLEKPQHGGKRKGAGRKKMKVSQNKAWGKVVRDLLKLEKYMQQRCELGADIDTCIKHQFYDHIDTLQIFLNDFEKE